MREYPIMLQTEKDIVNLVTRIDKIPYPVEATSDCCTVDAKSILGVIAIGGRDNIYLRAYSDDCRDLEKIVKDFQ